MIEKQTYSHVNPGFVKREGRGGDSDTYFFLLILFLLLRHSHYWVGVPSAYQTDLRGDKQQQQKRPKKRKIGRKKGGGAAADLPPPPPPPIRRCVYMLQFERWPRIWLPSWCLSSSSCDFSLSLTASLSRREYSSSFASSFWINSSFLTLSAWRLSTLALESFWKDKQRCKIICMCMIPYKKKIFLQPWYHFKHYYSVIATLVGGGREKPPLRDKNHH